MKRWDEAVQPFEQAIRLRSNYPEAWNYKGVALANQGRQTDALSAYRQAIKLRPNYSVALKNLGGLLHRLGRLDEAVAAYRQYLKHNPNASDVLSDLGVALFHKGATPSGNRRVSASVGVAAELLPGYDESGDSPVQNPKT